MVKRVQIDQTAPDFSLKGVDGRKIKLSDFKDKSNVLLVFNRGFM